MMKAVLSGRGDEIIDLAKSTCFVSEPEKRVLK